MNPEGLPLRATIALPLAATLLVGCSHGPSRAGPDDRVHWAGTMHAAVQEGDAAAKVDLRDLLSRPHLNAVGPVENFRGEITVIDGRPSIATAVDGAVSVRAREDVGAAFLAWAYVAEWDTRPIPGSVRTIADLEEHLASIVPATGAPTALRIEAEAEHLRYHIIWHGPDTPTGHDAHDRAKVRREAAGVRVSIVGFFAPEHTGIFIPRGRSSHLHALSADDPSISGHVDEILLAPGATLLLPR